MGEAWLTTSEAAEMLHVSPRQVQRLVNDGTLLATRTDTGRLRIPRLAVEINIDFPRAQGRRWSYDTAWKVLTFLEHPDDPSWVERFGTEHVMGLLSIVRGEAARAQSEGYTYPVGRVLAGRLSSRSDRYHVRVDPKHLAAIMRVVVPTGRSLVNRIDSHLPPDEGRITGYIERHLVRSLVHRFGLRYDLGGEVTLHVVDTLHSFRQRLPAPSTIEADLTTSPVAEERTEGFRLLQRRMELISF